MFAHGSHVEVAGLPSATDVSVLTRCYGKSCLEYGKLRMAFPLANCTGLVSTIVLLLMLCTVNTMSILTQ
jgi:hypothetical protein